MKMRLLGFFLVLILILVELDFWGLLNVMTAVEIFVLILILVELDFWELAEYDFRFKHERS